MNKYYIIYMTVISAVQVLCLGYVLYKDIMREKYRKEHRAAQQSRALDKSQHRI